MSDRLHDHMTDHSQTPDRGVCGGQHRAERRRWSRAAALATSLAAGGLLMVACTGTPATTESTSESTSVPAGAGGEADQAASYQGGDAAGASTMALPSATAAPVSTSGPVPQQGDISQEVPAQTLTTEPARPADEPGDFGTGVTTRVTSISAVDGVAAGPGESAAPAVAVTVEFENSSDQVVGMNSVQVDLQTQDGTSASSLSGPPSAPLSGALQPGQKASGTYVFDVADNQRADFDLLVSYSTDAPVLHFTGTV